MIEKQIYILAKRVNLKRNILKNTIFSVNNQLFFGNNIFLITGKSCSKMSLTRASSELSVIIDPSLLLKKTPPIIFL